MPVNKESLTSRLKTLREKEHEKRARQLELAEAVVERDLNPDELKEQEALEGEIQGLLDQQTAVERSLGVGAFSPTANDDVGLNEREKRDFSLLKLIRAKRAGATDADRAAASLELEASGEAERKMGTAPRGVWLPKEVVGEGSLRYSHRPREQRDVLIDDYSAVGAFVGVDFRPQQLIPLLRNMMALTQLGARYLDGLVGDVAIPKHTGTGTARWLGRDGESITETQQTVGQVSMTPRTLGCYTDWTRQIEMQSSVAVENFIREDLMRVMALEIDRAAFHGTGVGGQPLGVTNVSGTNSVTLGTGAGSGTPDRDDIINMRKELALDNALMAGVAFVTEPTVFSNMMKEAIDTGSGEFLINSEDGTLLNRTIVESNQIEDNTLILGNWADLLVGRWGTFDLMVDPYTQSTAAITRLLVFQSTDVVVRHEESFCIAK